MADTTILPGLTREEFKVLEAVINEFHTYTVGPGKCSSILSQRIKAPLGTVWQVVRRFDKPQSYKHFIKSCSLKEDQNMTVGCLREVNVISGLPAATSTERLDILDDDRHVTGFSIIGGEHRLKNYRSVTTVNEFSRGRGGNSNTTTTTSSSSSSSSSSSPSDGGGKIWTVVLESYVVDVPDGNTEEDARMFADTVVRLNLQKLATLTEGMAASC